ncbi:orotidine-5'-phosphate decarboxylase [Alcaligenes endophyticus]|uniref:Orotidine 5'-phosphate decarboxylase n=1 Tax=Alcaligenes endophyticus TaxID=1929088 RepID=A0ABT8EMD0_9BURK|nr:orotidine-5'-phosphate decarboxylase [Alcaligenes endophyticus]MCX5590957.1 orotidine-5'-phosphate decarboxylase [Alcaligenes endophyticus]MDN4122466.1 orotidine-5'-phosphate decarboxylase [Alcaligenes endophyticus]
MKFLDKLNTAWQTNNSMLMVGLDPDPRRLPKGLLQRNDGIFHFCKGIVDATAEYICGIKPQIAYFASESAEEQLQALCDYVRQTYPHLPIVLDAKRGDIGSTAEHYALEAFERYRADAVTVNPYMGYDSVEPYLEWQDKGLIVLCRTSNPGGSDLQFLKLESGEPLYLHLASMVAEKWNAHQQCGLVVGATFPDEIALVRARVGDMPLLIPGIGAQGGDINATVQAGADAQGLGMMINSSRAIIYASREENWREAAQAAAIATRNAINNARRNEAS